MISKNALHALRKLNGRQSQTIPQVDPFFFKRFYLFFREVGREGERERNISVCGCL